MDRLTTKQHWEDVWAAAPGIGRKPALPRRRSLWRRLFGDRLVSFKDAYNYYLLWSVHFPRYLPSSAGLRVIEVGSAPGLRLVDFHLRLGYEPFGVEYSNTGVESNRKVFEAHGVPPANVIHSDFFAEDFQRDHEGRYDVVVSWGFLEHFDDPRAVVAGHVRLLGEGGHLVVMIPNLRGVYGPLVRFFWPELLGMHNLRLMELPTFRAVFEDQGLTPLYCGYSGLFSFQKLQVPPGSAKRHLLKLARAVNLPLNVIHRLLFPRGGPESGLLSQDILYIGRRADRPEGPRPTA